MKWNIVDHIHDISRTLLWFHGENTLVRFESICIVMIRDVVWSVNCWIIFIFIYMVHVCVVMLYLPSLHVCHFLPITAVCRLPSVQRQQSRRLSSTDPYPWFSNTRRWHPQTYRLSSADPEPGIRNTRVPLGVQTNVDVSSCSSAHQSVMSSLKNMKWVSNKKLIWCLSMSSLMWTGGRHLFLWQKNLWHDCGTVWKACICECNCLWSFWIWLP